MRATATTTPHTQPFVANPTPLLWVRLPSALCSVKDGVMPLHILTRYGEVRSYLRATDCFGEAGVKEIAPIR